MANRDRSPDWRPSTNMAVRRIQHILIWITILIQYSNPRALGDQQVELTGSLGQPLSYNFSIEVPFDNPSRIRGELSQTSPNHETRLVLTATPWRLPDDRASKASYGYSLEFIFSTNTVAVAVKIDNLSNADEGDHNVKVDFYALFVRHETIHDFKIKLSDKLDTGPVEKDELATTTHGIHTGPHDNTIQTRHLAGQRRRPHRPRLVITSKHSPVHVTAIDVTTPGTLPKQSDILKIASLPPTTTNKAKLPPVTISKSEEKYRTLEENKGESETNMASHILYPVMAVVTIALCCLIVVLVIVIVRNNRKQGSRIPVYYQNEAVRTPTKAVPNEYNESE
ncbi:uncharacterized protein LOC144440266 [Glandiceps talaboti]